MDYEITPEEVKAKLDRGDVFTLLDVREPKEYTGGQLPSAIHIPLSQLPGRASELAKYTARPIIAYCDVGRRSRIDRSRLETRLPVALAADPAAVEA